MKPHSLANIRLADTRSRAQKIAESGWAGRHGLYWPKGTVLPETRVLACPRVKVSEFPDGFLKQKHIEHLEQNQMISSCCRHPENHEVEAHKSHPDETAPDIYIFICTCGKQHRFFCVGMHDDNRPSWAA